MDPRETTSKFDEEIEEGLMEKMSPEIFKERFGDNMAVIVENEDKDKKRLIHDATHGVRVNHWIKCRDKLRAPGARFLACQLARDGPVGQLDNSCVYINKVGSFGVNCASSWWTRVAACGIRATHHLLGSCPIDVLLYADDLESLATTRKGRISHRPQLLLSHGARVSLQMVQDQRGISGRVARYGNGVFQLQARPHREESQLIGGLAAREDTGNVTAKEIAQGLQTRICRYLSRLGEAFSGAATCLVFRYSGLPKPHDDTRHAESPLQLAGR